MTHDDPITGPHAILEVTKARPVRNLSAWFLAVSALAASVGVLMVGRHLAEQDDVSDCRADAAFDASYAAGQLLSGFSQMVEGGFGEDRDVILLEMARLRVNLDRALGRQAAALNEC